MGLGSGFEDKRDGDGWMVIVVFGWKQVTGGFRDGSGAIFLFSLTEWGRRIYVCYDKRIRV